MDLKLDLEVGVAQLDQPLRIKASGPYRSNKGKLPSFDLDFSVTAGDAGQPGSLGGLSTGDRLFFKFADTFYEVDRREVARANGQLGGRRENRCQRRGIRVEPRPWIEDATDEGEETVAGTTAVHVSGTLDVDRMLRDLNEFVAECGQLLGAAASGAPDPLSRKELDELAQDVSDPRFHVYVGEEDDVVRRMSASVEARTEGEGRSNAGAIRSLKFSLEFANVNGDQRVEAPAKSRPLRELTSQLGAGALSGGLGLGDGTGGVQPPAQGGSGGSGTGGASPELEQFQSYADCLDKAEPDDAEALQRCSELLQRR